MAYQKFSLRYDWLTRIVSTGVAALLLALPILTLPAGLVALFVALISTAILGLTYAFSPRAYEISNGELRIKRLIGDVVFPLDNLRFVRDATRADFWGSIRLAGSGGLFGYYGTFWSKTLGRSKWYVTDRGKALIVAVGDRIILVSPEDRDAFVAAIPRAENTTLPHSPPARGFGMSIVPVGIGLVITAVVVALMAAGFLYDPGRPSLDLNRDSLVIHSRFYGMTVTASSIDVPNVRVVDLQAEPGWRPVLRTDGFANQHYRAGNFRTANGRPVKLFTTGTQRLVLLPPSSSDGTPLLLDAGDPDQLAARIRQQWTSN